MLLCAANDATDSQALQVAYNFIVSASQFTVCSHTSSMLLTLLLFASRLLSVCYGLSSYLTLRLYPFFHWYPYHTDLDSRKDS
jgi:hypothetical protein